ncbi:MAG: methyltransferase domain-containing protein [Acidobacteria bacterium]|nr:methyltransferase domain-containing protein [Acidobacteriota bacterium]
MTHRSGTKFQRDQFKKLERAYQPLVFEAYDPHDPRFRVPMHYMLKNRTRFLVALQTAFPYFPPAPLTIADLGTYPGSLLRLLRSLLTPKPCRLIGIGLMTSHEFCQAMTEDCHAEILTTNLDPANDQLREGGHPTRIPLDDESVHFAFALEIIEHLVSPLHLFAEAHRILVPGGHFLVTTPNITRIGNVFKLLIGRSNCDRLIPPDYQNPVDEWRPHFREYSLSETCDMFRTAGFQITEAWHFCGRFTTHNVKSISHRLIDLAKQPFHLVPHFRDSLLVVGRKPPH